MKKFVLSLLFLLIVVCPASAGSKVPPNWGAWEVHPEVERISAPMVADLLMKGEKMVFVYAGYKKADVICSSIFMPYNKIPPYEDGSSINMPDFPKDTLMVVY